MPDDPRQQLVSAYRWLRQYGLNDSHSGNASVRDGDTVWVTPSGCCADTLQSDDLIACSLEAGPGAGASLDATLHLAVYRARPETRCVLHYHGVHLIALTLDGSDFEPLDFEGAYYFATIPTADAPYEDYVERSPELIAALLAQHRVAVYRGHGVYACGDSVDQAYKWACSAEHSAHIAYLKGRIG